MKKKYMYLTLVLLIVLTIFVIIKPNKRQEVNVINGEKEQNSFAIYKDDGSGNYIMSSDASFPIQGYLLNMDKTKCYDSNNNGISNNIVSQSLDGKITLSATVSTYCDLYFTKDSTIPVVTSFSITGKDVSGNDLVNGYTYNNEVTYNIGWNDTDVTHYCLTTNSTSCDKQWVETNGEQNITVKNSTFTSTEGAHTIYVYLRDKAQNVSSTTEISKKTITVDKIAPVVKSLTLTGKDSKNGNLTNGYTYSNTISWSSEWDDTDVANICVASGTSCTPGSTVAKSGNVTIEDKEGTKTVVIQVKDYANNVSTAVTKTIIVDKTAPSITGFTITGKNTSGGTLNTTYSQQVGVTYKITWSASDVSGYCITSGSSCSNFTTVSSGTSVSPTTPNLPTGDGNKTMNAFIKDKANNVSVVKSASIFLDLNNPTVTSVSYTTKDKNSITVNVSGNDGSGSGVVTKQCKATTQSTWTTQSGSTCKVTGLNENTSYTIEARVIDASGRISTNTNYTKVTQTTDQARTGSYLLKNPPAGLVASSEPICDDITMRFIGDCNAANNGCDGEVDNFVCFGYSNVSDCSDELKNNDYIYRIIGITSDGKMRLIKNKPLDGSYQWHKYEGTFYSFTESDILNTAIIPYITGLTTTWSKKLVISKWPVGKIYDDRDINTPKLACFYSLDVETTDSLVGLMREDDYFYTSFTLPSYVFNEDSWLYIFNNGLEHEEKAEWTMVRVGRQIASSTFGGVVFGEGNVNHGFGTRHETGKFVSPNTYDQWVRPVIVLDSSVVISSGSGTSSSPFIVAK